MVRSIESHSHPQSHNVNVSSATSNTNSREDETGNGQDHLLPIANVGRIMKQVLPANAKISKEAKETMQDCASEFIGFITGEASHQCRTERRKTVSGDDVCNAMKTFGLDQYADTSLRFLQKYREHAEKSNSRNQDKAIQINVIDELSILRGANPHNGKQSGKSKRHT